MDDEVINGERVQHVMAIDDKGAGGPKRLKI
jgi:hypothetical protein